ncbi:TIGR03089 family protein [Gordonia sp. NPDC003429]
MAGDTLTDDLFATVTDWTRPLLTFYDDRTGERTELSAATLGNWAAKTANFLVAEIGVLPGDLVVVDLPEHWQTAGILLGAWWSGAQVQLDGDDADEAVVVLTSRERLDRYPDADEVLVASLDPFALGVRDLPVGVGDYASAVRVHGDQYPGLRYAGAAFDGRTGREIVADARAAAADSGIAPGSRVFSTREWHTHDGVVANLLAPLSVGASLVWVAPADTTDLAARAAAEKADVVLG